MKIHILCCFLFLGGLSLYAQETKEEIEKKALAHFDKQEFIEATPLYLRLLSLEPRDPNYNYRYGTCLLYNSKRKESAFKYLNFAVTSGDVDMEAYYYLGRAYHLTYQFRKAIDNYEKYKKLAGTRASNKLDVNRQIEMCRNGQTLLANLSQTLVLKKQEIPINEFFRIYDLKDIGGELIVTAEFQTKLDKKYNHVPLIHFPSKSDRIFYSSYGDNESSGKDIYMRTRLPDKSWSLAQKVFGDVNTEYDEDFPYMHPDGRYLYFCSKGHNSMGGFDVFRSRYDPETNTYMKPENMDFAISSPDDDILYIVDSLDRYAYFASQRESEAGKINVYHVRVERIPVQIAIIKGTFASTIDPGNKELSIAVYSDATGKLIGNFETTNKGDYLINLPKGGKYQFVLQVGGKDTEYKQVIDVPYLKEFRPLKQKITETIQDENEVVLIQNLFDELFDDPIAILAEVIQKQSQMQVNKDNYDLDSLDRIGEQRKVLANLGLEAYSHLEIRQMSQTKVDDLTARLEKSEERMAQALASIVDANQKTETLLKRADSLTLLANNTDDPEKKANYTRSAQQALINAKKQAEKIESAKIIAEFMEKDRNETFKRLEEAKKFNNELLAVSNDDENGFLAVLNNNKLYIEKELKTRTTIDAQFEMMSEINEQITRSEEALKKQKELITQKESLEKEIQQLKDELANAKRKEADRIQQEIDNKENLLSDIVNEQKYLEKEVDKYNQAIFQKEVLADLNNYDGNPEYSSLDNVMNSISSEISSIDSRIETNEEKIELYEANESDSKIISEVIDPVNNKADELISSSANIDKSYESNEMTTEQYISAKEKTLKHLKTQLESLEKANDEIKNNQDYKSVVVKLNNNIASTEKELNQANSIREVEKTLASEFETISKQPENSNKSSKEIENDLIASLENKKSNVTKDESITADEKESKIAAIDKLIDKLENSDGTYFEKDASIASTNESTSFTAEEKATVVNKIDKKYAADIAKIQNDLENGKTDEKALLDRKTDYKEALENALEKINNDIAKNGETPQSHKEKAILEQEIAAVQSEIAELNQIIAAKDASIASTNESTSFTAEEKATVVNKVDRSYSFDIGVLEKQLRNNEVSEKEVVARKEEYVNNLQKALDAVNKEIERKGESPERLKEKAILEQEIATVQSEIDELKQIIAAKEAAIASTNETTSFTAEEKANVINKVDRSYSFDIGELEQQLRNNEVTEKEVVARKEEYVNNLQKALDTVNKEIERKGESPEHLKEKAILEQEIATVQSEIAELNQIIAAKDASIASTNESTTFTAEEKATVVDKVDRSYSFDIGELENQLRNNEVSEKEVVARKEEYANNLQKALDAVNKEIERKGESPERLKEKAILEQEIATVQSEIDELKQIIAAKEAAIASTNETTSFTAEEKANVINKVDRSYSFDIGELEQQLRNNEVTEKEVVARKEEYVNNLQKALDTVNKEIERKGESPEHLKEKAILEQEIATVQSEIAELNQIIAAKDASIASTNESTSFTAEEKATVVNKVDRSYSFDIGELEKQLRNNEVSEKEVVARKEEYVNNLQKALDAVNKEIERKGESPVRLKEKAILEQEIAAVRLEIDQLQSPVATNEVENINFIAAKSTLSETEKAAISSTDKDLPSLKNKLAALDKLSLALKEQLSLETNEDIKLTLTKEIETVEKQKRQIRFEIGEMEQETNIASVPDNVKAATNEKQNKEIVSSQEKITDLSENKTVLEESLSNASSEAEKEKIQSKIDKTDQKIAKEESKVLSTTTEVSKEVLTNELNNLSTEEKTSINSLEAEQLRLNAERLIEQANKEKDPEVKRNLLAEAQEKQNEALAAVEKTKNDTQTQAVVAEIVSTENIDVKEQESLFTSEETLIREQQAIDVQLLQIKDQLKEIDLALRTASKKEIDQLETRRSNLVKLQKELIAKRNTNEGDLAIIQQEKEENASKGIDKESINYELSYKEEVEIAESDNYKALFPAINKLEQKQYEMRVKEELIANNTAKINEILKNNSSPTQEEKKEVSNLLKSIAKEQNDLETIRLEIREQQSIINNLLPSDPREREITQNLLARNVTPVDKAPTLPVMATGLVIADEGEKNYTKENPIPLDIEKPKGLFFRVQIGAFGKPVPDETFNDFSPVSGEQVRPGLIRYMAGYFGGRGDAEQARDRIRAMGYSDAFVVAYCDGERIPVYRAVQLMESGACVPSITSSESPIIAASEAGTNTTSGGFEAELDEFAYNKAPGAAEAVAGETKLGLYYTVQVGVYNRPVPASQLKNISPLVTMRLPNGQMRYSSGMFDDVPQARVKQQEAIGLGITDAFIVAYYKGERITVAQANKLLQEFGNSILETVTPTQRKKNNLESTVRAPKPPAEPVLKDKKFTVQFISKETYSSYPTQVLNRYNESGGMFYYDETTGLIQSVIYNEDQVPSLAFIRNELEEKSYYGVFELLDKDATDAANAVKDTDQLVHMLTVKLTYTEISDDIMNTFMKVNLLKRITNTESGVIMYFYEKETAEKINNLQTEMVRLGATEISKTSFTCDLKDE